MSIKQLAFFILAITAMRLMCPCASGRMLTARIDAADDQPQRAVIQAPPAPQIAEKAVEQPVGLPQGHDYRNWPAAAQEFHKRCGQILANYFAEEWAGDVPAAQIPSSSKKHYLSVHASRFTHTLYRAASHIKPGSRILALGEKGHIPVLIEKLFQPSWIRTTSMDSAALEGACLTIRVAATGLHTYKGQDGNTVQVDILRHDLEAEPLPVPANSIDHIFLLEVAEHFTRDPMFALLEMHRVLKPNGTLFISTPNVASFASLVKVFIGEAPYLFSKYISPKDGRGWITHTREWSWSELAQVLQQAGFSPAVKCFNPYTSDTSFWRHDVGAPVQEYQWLWDALPTSQRNLDHMGTNLFVVATKQQRPVTRHPMLLYAYLPSGAEDFSEYPSCRYKPLFCSNEGTEGYFTQGSTLKAQLVTAAAAVAADIASQPLSAE